MKAGRKDLGVAGIFVCCLERSFGGSSIGDFVVDEVVVDRRMLVACYLS